MYSMYVATVDKHFTRMIIVMAELENFKLSHNIKLLLHECKIFYNILMNAVASFCD